MRHEHESTVLLVTHDIDESVYLGDRVLVLSKSPASIVADLTVDLPPSATRSRPASRRTSSLCAAKSPALPQPASSGGAGAVKRPTRPQRTSRPQRSVSSKPSVSKPSRPATKPF
ncbi:hypothetical protein [Kibdelosporangium philippinense]|uniref:hypothetical protein n=1 Tax=Kibdelosporangium philippinense TaxID=211113 RepID=UPI00361F5073